MIGFSIIVMCIYAFYNSFLLGIMILGYVLYMRYKNKNLHRITNSLINMKIDPPKKLDTRGKTLPDNFEIYKGCCVEKWFNDVYSVVTPSGHRLDKEFKSFLDATQEIDFVEPLFNKTKPKKQTITNVRFVR
jgi:hypothetical protein